MRQLSDCFENLLDTDYDIDDSTIVADFVKKTICDDIDDIMPDVEIDGEWVVIDCTKCKTINFSSIHSLKAVGCKKFRFINCEGIAIFSPNDGTDHLSDFEIDAPDARVEFYGASAPLKLTNIILNSQSLHVYPKDRGDAKITMKGCKFDTAIIDFYTIDRLSIADTCKFTNCKLLFLGRVGKSIASKAANLHMGDPGNGQLFGREIKTVSWEYVDKTKYQDIDVMKTLGLKTKTWPDLGKIVIVPVMQCTMDTPGICLYKLSNAMVPQSDSTNGEIVEFKNGWSGLHARYAYVEQNGVAK